MTKENCEELLHMIDKIWLAGGLSDHQRGLIERLQNAIEEEEVNLEKVTKRVTFKFETQENADDAVIALSRNYRVTQHRECVSSDVFPFIVNVDVPTRDIHEEY